MILYHELVGSICAGIVTTGIGHPLDSIKTYLQTKNHYHPSATTPTNQDRRRRRRPITTTTTQQAAYTLWKQKALFRGIAPPLWNAMIMNSVMFVAFRSIKENSSSSSSSWSSYIAGLWSGFATACISTPTDLIKIQAQTTAISGKRSSFQIFCQLWKQQQGRLSFFYTGHSINLAREGLFTMVYLGIYDHMVPTGFVQVAVTSSVTGALAWVASYPLDTIKTVVQANPGRLSVRQAVLQIYHVGGWREFYRGCLPSTGRAMMVTSLRMITYEAVAGWMSKARPV